MKTEREKSLDWFLNQKPTLQKKIQKLRLSDYEKNEKFSKWKNSAIKIGHLHNKIDLLNEMYDYILKYAPTSWKAKLSMRGDKIPKAEKELSNILKRIENIQIEMNKLRDVKAYE